MTICRLFLLAAVQMLFSGCATVIKTPVQRISVRTDPPGANVVLSTGEKGVTPFSVWKGRSKNFSVNVYKTGYKPISVNVNSRKSISGVVATVGNVAIGGLIGVGVDWLTGATNELYPSGIQIRLAPSDSPTHSLVLDKGERLPQYRTSPVTKPEPPRTAPSRTYVAAPPKPPRLAQTDGAYRTDITGTQYLPGY